MMSDQKVALTKEERKKYHADYHKEWYQKNKERRSAELKEYNEKNKAVLYAKRLIGIRTPEGRAKTTSQNKKYYRKYTEREAERTRIAKYGTEYTSAPAKPIVCDICHQLPINKQGLHFDHCHQSSRFRGWLCFRCNTTLGRVKESIELLSAMQSYLSKV